MDPQRFSAKAKADRVRREKGGLHEYGVQDEPIVPLCAVGPPSPVSGLVHEDYVPRDVPSIRPITHVVAPTPLYGLVAEDIRYPDILPCIFEALGADERRLQLQVNIPCWREVNICLAMLRTKARHPYIEVFLGDFIAYWSIQTRESVNLMRTSRPVLVAPNFMPSLSGGRYHEC